MDSHQSSPSHSPPSSPPPSPSQVRSPSRRERIFTTSILALFGVAFGLGLFTFVYARGFSYLSDNPATCVNCHIMRDQYEGWSHSSHKAVATCNDCHTPHRFPDKWIIKGINGWNHSVAFTTGNFPDPIRIRGFNARIAQENCVDCHTTTVSQMHLNVAHEESNCVACHGNVGHHNEAITRPPRTVLARFGAVPPSGSPPSALPIGATPQPEQDEATSDAELRKQIEQVAGEQATEEQTGPDQTEPDSDEPDSAHEEEGNE